MSKEYMNVNELSAYLGINRFTIYSKAIKGEIPRYKIGRLVRFKKVDIDRWMETQKQNPVDVDKLATNIVKKVKAKREVNIDSVIKRAKREAKTEEGNGTV
jgi:excisionase family DNA binding protein